MIKDFNNCTIAARRNLQLLLLCVGIIYRGTLHAENTAGVMLHVDPARFNHPHLIQLTWKAEISEYEYVPLSSYPFRIRIEFNSVGFKGRGTDNPYCSVGAMIMNLGHEFANDIVGSQFSAPPSITSFPALGLYLSSLQSTWADSYHGLQLLIDPNTPPRFGRVFENVDNLGYSAKNIYTRENVGNATPTAPITVKWTVTKGDTVVNPQGNFSKNLNGQWVSLVGTFVKWNFAIEINSVVYDVADYYLPIEKAEYISPQDPLSLHQEYFGAKEGILHAQKGTVRYTEMRAYDGSRWYALKNWKSIWRIDDGGGNLESRFGWRSDSTSLTSVVGHNKDASQAYRDVGRSFTLNFSDEPTSANVDEQIPIDFGLLQNYPNPFNPTTTISYTISTTCYATLQVFDVLGREVLTLVDGVQGRGTYWTIFDGSHYASNMYYYKLSAGGFNNVKKMIMIR